MSLCKLPLFYAPLLAQMHVKCFSESWTEQAFADLLALPTTVGFIDEYGFLLCSKVFDEMEVLTVGVLPEFRRQGYAAQMLQIMTDFAKQNQVAHIFLEVMATNTPAQSLYKKAGFVQTGLRKGYYKTPTGPTDAICMTKEIN